MNSTDIPYAPSSAQSGLLNGFYRAFALRLASGIEHGRLEVVEQGRQLHFGRSEVDMEQVVRVEIVDPGFWRMLFLGGSNGAAEAYMQGMWRCADLVGLIRLFVRNGAMLQSLDSRFSRFGQYVDRLIHLFNRNTRAGARKNISAHYDLGNDFFRLMLDPTMMYSAAYYSEPGQGLDHAAVNKLDRICRSLQLGPQHHVLEIGTGWGGFALHAANHYGCRVTTATISQQQFEYTRERVAEAGLQDRIEVLLRDYRDLEGSYDKLVSIEMIEAIGHQYMDGYFRQCAQLLKPEGEMFLQAITISDRHYDRALRETDFIKRYIFPGGFLPSVSKLSEAIARNSHLKIVHLEDIGYHYAQTLRDWRKRFFSYLDQIKAMGYGEEFQRMWEFYLCYCEGGFRENYLGTVQMVLSGPQSRGHALPDTGNQR